MNTTLKTSLVVFAGCFSLAANAQQNPSNSKKFGKPIITASKYCGTVEYEKLLKENNPKRVKDEAFELWLAPKVAEAKTKRLQKNGQGTNAIVTIPVVFHIIHNGDEIGTGENIPEEQILSQITVLNQDFRRMADTNGFNTNPVGADMEIEFCLAKRDPNGVSSNGIVRYNMGDDNGWSMEEVESLKIQTQWDPTKYLNIWVCDDIYNLAGYAQFPTQSGLPGLDGQTSTSNTDGVALGAIYVGSEEIYPEGTYSPTRNLGRSASHEVGHFLGLRHIWGDTGGCNATDYCADTPAALAATIGCPTDADTCPSPGMDMIENYMDYTNDSCLNIFTQNQKDRMQAVLANSPNRKTLITSNGCEPGTTTFTNDGSLHIIPFSTNCGNTFMPGIYLRNTGTSTITSAVINYTVDNNTSITHNWTGSIIAGEGTRIELPVITALEGDHSFEATLTSVNGNTDELVSNNSKIYEFFIDETPPNFDTQIVTITVKTDDNASEVTWLLMDSNQNPIAFGTGFENTPGGVLDIREVPVNDNSCYAFVIIENSGDGMPGGYYSLKTSDGTIIKQTDGTDIEYFDFAPFAINIPLNNKEIKKTLNNIKLYPNPANSILNITISDNDIPEGYTVYNNLGQVMDSGAITTTTQSLDIAGYANGVYFVKLVKDEQSKTLQFIKH